MQNEKPGLKINKLKVAFSFRPN